MRGVERERIDVPAQEEQVGAASLLLEVPVGQLEHDRWPVSPLVLVPTGHLRQSLLAAGL